jgi:glyoxylase-like metal-dependent hydrolase (beta-lactamase superfamily II)
MRRIALLCLVLLSPFATAADLVLKPVEVAPKIYAVIGDLAGQTYENEGLNNNLGFVVSDTGVIVINTGPTQRVAKALHAAIQQVSKQPVRVVINVNSQNHYWLGNDYFKKLGATIIATQAAERVMREQGPQQLEANKTLLKEKAEGTALAYPAETFTDKKAIKLGATVIELRHFGPAHTPGDLVVWLPQTRVLFSGDLIYTERMLAIIPIGDTRNWVKAFDQAVALNPAVIVPGHGRPTTVAQAKAQTRDYLDYLLTSVKQYIDKDQFIDDAVKGIDQSKYKDLVNYDLLARRNVYNLYLEFERAF